MIAPAEHKVRHPQNKVNKVHFRALRKLATPALTDDDGFNDIFDSNDGNFDDNDDKNYQKTYNSYDF